MAKKNTDHFLLLILAYASCLQAVPAAYIDGLNSYAIFAYSIGATILIPYPFIYIYTSLVAFKEGEGPRRKREERLLYSGFMLVMILSYASLAIFMGLDN